MFPPYPLPLPRFQCRIRLEARLKGEWGCLRARASFVTRGARLLTACRQAPHPGLERWAGWSEGGGVPGVGAGWGGGGPRVLEGPQPRPRGARWREERPREGLRKRWRWGGG